MSNVLWTQGLTNRGIWWQPELVAQGSIAAGTNKLDYTSDNSFVEFGVDLSTYRDEKHRIVVTDSADKSASGYLSNIAPGGETLSDEIGV